MRGMVGEAGFPPDSGARPALCRPGARRGAASVRRGPGERPATARAFGDLSRSAARARDAPRGDAGGAVSAAFGGACAGCTAPPAPAAPMGSMVAISKVAGGASRADRRGVRASMDMRISPLPVKSSTKRRRIVRRPAAGSLMPDSWERGRPARRRARGPPHGKAGGTPALPGSPSVWFRLRRSRVSCPMLDCHGKVSSIDRRGKESESPDGEGGRVDAKAEIGWNPPRSRRSGAPAIEASRQCGPRVWFPPRDARTGHAVRSGAGTPAALTNRLQLEERSSWNVRTIRLDPSPRTGSRSAS